MFFNKNGIKELLEVKNILWQFNFNENIILLLNEINLKSYKQNTHTKFLNKSKKILNN